MKIIKHLLLLSIILTIILGCSNTEEIKSVESELPQEENIVDKEIEVNTFMNNDNEAIDYSFTLLSEDVSIEYGLNFNPFDYITKEDREKDIKIENPVNTNLAGSYVVSYAFGDMTKNLHVKVLDKPVVENIEIHIVSLTSPVNPGQDATIQIKGIPHTTYSINVYYKSGASKSNDLYPKESDSEGLLEWTWQVGSRTSSGEWKITIESEVDSITTYFKVN